MINIENVSRSKDKIFLGTFVQAFVAIFTVTWAPSQYKDRLIYVWRFPC